MENEYKKQIKFHVINNVKIMSTKSKQPMTNFPKWTPNTT